jgi:outer membrane lipoprotein-sorting protein
LFGSNFSTPELFKHIDMKNMLLIALCSATVLISGCATSHTSATAWEYKTDAAWVNDVSSEIAKFGQDGWRLVSMSAVNQASDNIKVVLLFKRHK